MVEFQAVVNDINLFKEVVDFFSRRPDEEITFPTPYGAVSLRSWKEGVHVRREVSYDFDKKKFVMKDTVTIQAKPELQGLIERLSKKLKEVV